MIDATIDTSPKALKKFGHLFAVVCALVAPFLWWKESPAWRWVVLGIPFFLGTGYLAQPVLKPLYIKKLTNTATRSTVVMARVHWRALPWAGRRTP